MVDTKTIIFTSALSAICGALLLLGGITIFDEKVYYCEERNIVMQCDNLSQYYLLPNGKCWNSVVGNKLCRTGWLEVQDDMKEVIPCGEDCDEEFFDEDIIVVKPDYKDNCEVIIIPYVELVPVYKINSTYDSENDSWTNISYIASYDKVLKNSTRTECKPTIKIGNDYIEPELQDWKCSNQTGEVICTNCAIDPYCNGVCDPNGGAPCARIKNGMVQYKDGVVEWDKPGAAILVKKLEVR